jgi:acetate kinase
MKHPVASRPLPVNDRRQFFYLARSFYAAMAYTTFAEIRIISHHNITGEDMAEQAENYSLCINCGSSSLKFSIYRANTCLLELSGQISRIGQENSGLEIKDTAGQILESRSAHYTDFQAAVSELITWLSGQKKYHTINTIAHRLVQGGPDHREPEIITDELLDDLERYTYLATNHLPVELATIRAFRAAYPGRRQIACFDTAFHRHMPDIAKNYPLPVTYREKGLFKYGFHGLSFAYILEELIAQDPVAARQKMIIAHLGNGASMAAVDQGCSVDTTMGVSPLGGLVMGSRSGDLDPGVLLFLLNQYQMTPAELEELLSKHAGLKAIAGVSDVQQLLEMEPENTQAKEALAVFCYSARKHIGSLAAALEGLETLVFTGGIGENAAIIRERICKGLRFWGLELDVQKNAANENTISTATSRVIVRVIKTDEELMMARLVRAAASIN